MTFDQIYERIHNIEGWFNREQALVLYDYVKILPPDALLVEIGTYHGKSTKFFSLVNPRIKILTIDLVAFPEVPERAGVTIDEDILKSGNICQLIGDNVDIARGFHWWIDFLFIDGNHEKSQVLKDIQAWQDRVKIGAIIAFHDYEPTHQGVIDATGEWLYNNNSYIIEKCQAGVLLTTKHAY